MLLAADIGNTNITLGLFNSNGKYINEYRLASDKDLSVYEYEVLLDTLFRDYNIDSCIVASVVEELNKKFCTAIEKVFAITPIFLTNKTYTGIKIVTDKPEEVGSDRIANAAAVSWEYNSAVIVVDFGTATTFDIVNSKGEFCGGVIAPGLNTQLKCLEQVTSKLPRIEASISPCAVGHNTQEAILSGVIRGTACMVDGLIAQCEKELGEKAVIIATGGYCGLIANYLKRPFDKINPILTLEGLCKIYNLNMSHKH